ncbi:MAG: archaetidylinositol phosphate synthase [Anaerolineae bacterium]
MTRANFAGGLPVSSSQLPTTPNLSTRLRALAADSLARVGRGLAGLGIHPDVLTILGLGVTLVGAWAIVQGQFLTAAIILVLGLPLDALDGAVARAMGRTNPFGGVLDSVVDRAADMILLLSLAYHLALAGQFDAMLWAFAALVGSVLVSYIRARAGAAGLPCAGGFFSRFERLAVLLIMLLTGWITAGLVVLAIGSNLTALQRLWSVARFAEAKNLEKEL